MFINRSKNKKSFVFVFVFFPVPLYSPPFLLTPRRGIICFHVGGDVTFYLVTKIQNIPFLTSGVCLEGEPVRILAAVVVDFNEAGAEGGGDGGGGERTRVGGGGRDGVLERERRGWGGVFCAFPWPFFRCSHVSLSVLISIYFSSSFSSRMQLQQT